jgi:hypothetical protein
LLQAVADAAQLCCQQALFGGEYIGIIGGRRILQQGFGVLNRFFQVKDLL